MKNQIFITTLALLLFTSVVLAQSDGGVSTGPGATIAQNVVPTANITNQSLHVAEVHGFTYGTTNPVDVWGAWEHPTANGHYTFSAPDHGLTNINHIFLYIDATSFEWEFGPTNSDPNVNTNWYYYVGSNVFPTNSYQGWTDASMVSLFGVNVGTAVSTNYVTSLTYQGESVIDQGSSESTPIRSVTGPNGNLFFVENMEDTAPYFRNFFEKQFAYPLQSYTNLYDTAHNLRAGIQCIRLNGGVLGIAGDNRGGAIVCFVYGTNWIDYTTNVVLGVTNIFTNANLAHIGDFGGSFEFVIKRAAGYSTPETASWSFVSPLKSLGDGALWLGNNPQSEHGVWPFASQTAYSPGTVNLRGEAKRPTLLFLKSAAYTGTMTNGGMFSDGLDVFLISHGGAGAILTSNGPTMIGGTNYGIFTLLGSMGISNAANINSASITNSLTNAGWTLLVGPLTNSSTVNLPTNTASILDDTNDLIIGKVNIGPAQRFSVSLSAYTNATLSVGARGDLVYSNFTTGTITRYSFSIPSGVLANDTQTNDLSIPIAEPNSRFWLTNCFAVPGTSRVTKF